MITATVAVAVYLICTVFCFSNYDIIGEGTFVRNYLVGERSYHYEDVDNYQLYVKIDGTLGYKIVFTDGKSMDIYGTINNEVLDSAKYPEGADDFAVFLSERFAQHNVPLKTIDEQKLYKRLRYDYWDEIAKKIMHVSVDAVQ